MTERLGDRDLAELIRSAAVVASQAQLQDVLQATVERAMKLTGAEYGAIGVVGPDGLLIDFHFAGIDKDTAREIGHYPEGKGILGLISTGTALKLDRIADHPESAGFPRHHPKMETFLGVPIQVGERLFGNLYLTEKPRGFTDSDQALTEALAVIAASAISNARASEQLLQAALIGDRARIARDLHDAIIQELYAVGLSLQGLSVNLEGDARERVSAAVDQLDTSIAALRRFIFDLRPPIWARRQLAREIKSLVREMSLAYNASIDLSLEGEFDDVSEATTETASLVVRESLSNALRHASATHVGVEVRLEGDMVSISVVDDGIGFDLDATPRGMGLDNIAQRVLQRGGEMKIKSAAGAGTNVAIRLPS